MGSFDHTPLLKLTQGHQKDRGGYVGDRHGSDGCQILFNQALLALYLAWGQPLFCPLG